MVIKEITINDFKEFLIKNNYNGYRQTLEYALLKSENNYEYEIIGYCDNNDAIKVAALVLVKIINNSYLYGYIPEGFIADYTDESLIKSFTADLIKYYKKEGLSFIKINPRIPIFTINLKTHEKVRTDNSKIITLLNSCGYKKQEEIDDFDEVLPRVGCIVDLKSYDFNKLEKNTKNKIKRGIRKGLTLEIGNSQQVEILNKFIKNKINKPTYYYNDLYNIFNREGNVDLFLISIDYNRCLLSSKNAYEREKAKNDILKYKVSNNPSKKNINKRLNSDKALESYKNDIIISTKHAADPKEYIAGALVVKNNNKASIAITGYNKLYNDFAPNYYLFEEIINYYKDDYDFLDLDGIVSNFSINSKYHGLNKFKLGYKPDLYEYIGEFDLVINGWNYNHLKRKGILKKEFNSKS